FVGLVIDEDNQDDLTDGRISKWVAEIKGSFA
ncbi:flavodoxin, partial [Helicobacter pylori]|nr:flavodoxin [Helicobacter pylori]